MSWTSRNAGGWWAGPAAEAVRAMGSHSSDGMSSRAVAAKAKSEGPNRLAEQTGRSGLALLVDHFKSTLVVVLVLASVLSAAVGDLKDAVVIMIVIVLNALVGFWQEYRAEKSLSTLKKMLPASARVRRDGVSAIVPADSLVSGDLVLLEAGDRVPADGRLLATHGVAIDESTLTGESHPGEKDADARLPV